MALGGFPLAPGGGMPAITPPTVTFVGATLVRAPSAQLLAAHYCPELVSVPFGGGALLCQQFFGPRPNLEAMTVAFDLRFRISNPNQVPMPLTSVSY